MLLTDDSCSALDPTSPRVVEETILAIGPEVTIVSVPHNVQQARRVSSRCASFLAEAGTPGVVVEHGDTEAMVTEPIDRRTADDVQGRLG